MIGEDAGTAQREVLSLCDGSGCGLEVLEVGRWNGGNTLSR